MKKGFTLIELLVIVLIIGVLAAVALPQYQKAVRKARMAEAFTLVKTAAQAVDAYIMSNGVMPTDWKDLDIQMPGTDGVWGTGVSKKTKYYMYILENNRIQAFTDNNELPQLIYLSSLADYSPDGNHFYCVELTGSDSQKDGLCKAMATGPSVPSPTYPNFIWYPLL